MMLAAVFCLAIAVSVAMSAATVIALVVVTRLTDEETPKD